MISKYSRKFFISIFKLGGKTKFNPVKWDSSTSSFTYRKGGDWLACAMIGTTLLTYGVCYPGILILYYENYKIEEAFVRLVLPTMMIGLCTIPVSVQVLLLKEALLLTNLKFTLDDYLKKYFVIPEKKMDGTEPLLLAMFLGVIGSLGFRILSTLVSIKFIAPYHYAAELFWKESENELLWSIVAKMLFYAVDWYAVYFAGMTLISSVSQLFIYLNSVKLWCRKMTDTLLFPELAHGTLKSRVLFLYNCLMIRHRLFSKLYAKIVMPMVMAGGCGAIIMFLFILMRFIGSLHFLSFCLIGGASVTTIFGLSVILYFSVGMTNSSIEFIKAFRLKREESRVGRAQYYALQPLFIQVGDTGMIDEGTLMNIFRFILDNLINLLLGV